MNFPNATAADWTRARSRLIGFLRSHGVDPDRAEEIAQSHISETMTREYRARCPASLAVAIGGALARARRYGIGSLTRRGEAAARHRRRTGQQEPQPAADPAAVPDRAPGWSDPATMAAAGESLAARCPRYAQRARAEGLTPAALALRAAGWGPLDEEDAERTTPAVAMMGPGHTPPRRGVPGLHTDTDPNPASREKARRDADAAAERVGLIVTRRAG